MAAAGDKEPGHQVPRSNVYSEEAADPEITAFQEHQRTAPRISIAEEARTLVSLGRHGVLSTLSAGGAAAGYPSGAVVQYAEDENGLPVVCTSALSAHTGDLKADGRCSLTVSASNSQGLQDARVILTGDAVVVGKDEVGALREAYLKRNPEAFWVDFGDFTWFRMARLVTGRLVGGFARAGSFTPEQYAEAAPDPVAAFSAPIAGHMNADHAEANIAIVKQVAGITVDKADILNLDRLGMNMQCTRGAQTFKARIPFPRPAQDRKDIKTLIVDMTKAAKQEAQPATAAA